MIDINSLNQAPGETNFTFLLDVQHRANPVLIGGGNQAGMSQIAFLLRGFLGQDMALKRMLPLNFARPGQSKPFLGTRLCFYFRHLY